MRALRPLGRAETRLSRETSDCGAAGALPCPARRAADRRAQGARRDRSRLNISLPAPALVAASDPRAEACFWEFFVAQIRTPHTWRAYGRAVRVFLVWRAAQDVVSVVRP